MGVLRATSIRSRSRATLCRVSGSPECGPCPCVLGLGSCWPCLGVPGPPADAHLLRRVLILAPNGAAGWEFYFKCPDTSGVASLARSSGSPRLTPGQGRRLWGTPGTHGGCAWGHRVWRAGARLCLRMGRAGSVGGGRVSLSGCQRGLDDDIRWRLTQERKWG